MTLRCDCPLCREYRRGMTRIDWLFVVTCLVLAAACVYLIGWSR